jgi:hypothetical protein
VGAETVVLKANKNTTEKNMAPKDDRRIEKTATEARAGVTGQNVRYVLAASLIGVIVVFGGLWYFWAG